MLIALQVIFAHLALAQADVLSCYYGDVKVNLGDSGSPPIVEIADASHLTQAPNKFCIGFIECRSNDDKFAIPCQPTSSNVHIGFRSVAMADLPQLYFEGLSKDVTPDQACIAYTTNQRYIDDDFSGSQHILCCYETGCNNAQALIDMVQNFVTK